MNRNIFFVCCFLAAIGSGVSVSAKSGSLTLVDAYKVDSGFVAIEHQANHLTVRSIQNLPNNRYVLKKVNFDGRGFQEKETKISNARTFKEVSTPVFKKYETVVQHVMNLRGMKNFLLFEEIDLGTEKKAKIFVRPEVPNNFTTKLVLVEHHSSHEIVFEYGFVDDVSILTMDASAFYFVTIAYCGASSCSSQVNVYKPD
ncbi:MAG: hypothetical protein HYU99_10525 [Deltaproteobacteria bacterium]|nr:hypothetical protein [Deltaproteobacteria bacterium]